MRTKFPDKTGKLVGVRKGKYIAQGSHAASAFLTDKARKGFFAFMWATIKLYFDKAAWSWLTTSYAKVVCQVETQQELEELYQKALDQGIRAHLIVDSGKTEFGGEPTVTALGIGPDFEEKIDIITGKLPLY